MNAAIADTIRLHIGNDGAPAETTTESNLGSTTGTTTGTLADTTSSTLADTTASNTEKSTTDTADRLAPDTSTTTGTTGTTSSSLPDNPTSTNEGPHSSETANKMDPRVDSDKDNSATLPPSTSTSDDTPKTSTGAPATNPDPIAPSQAPAANTSSSSDNAPGGISSTGAVQPSVDAEPVQGRNQGVKNEGADKPLDEPAKMEDVTEGSAGKPKVDEAVGSTGGGDITAPKPKEEKNDTPGTGEKWEKTTGVAAEGGNFEATKPGAGREADSEFIHLWLWEK